MGLLWCSWAHAAPPDKPSAKPNLQINDKESNRRQQASAWREFYAGRYEDSVKLCEPLLKSPFEWARVEAQHCQARCYWAVGTKAARSRAKQIWALMEKNSTLNSNVERLKIAQALQNRAIPDLTKGLSILKEVCNRNLPDTCTAEAAIEFADFSAHAKGFNEAKQMLEWTVSFLEKQGKAEMPPSAATPFMAEAKRALERLRLNKDDASDAFENAEKLRRAGKFPQALEAHRAVMKGFYGTDWHWRSEMTIGHCLAGMKKAPAAVDYWEKFIKAGPSGAYRAQALTGLIDLCLVEMLDAGQARKYADLAQDTAENGLKDVHGAASWKSGMFDLECRIGTVALIRGDTKAALRAFQQALDVKDSQDASGVQSLMAIVKSGGPLVPEELSEGKDAGDRTKSKTQVAMSLGTIYNLTGAFEQSQRYFDIVLKTLPKTPPQSAYAVFGSGASLQGQDRPEEAQKAFEKSLKDFPGGSWQDETLFRLARMSQSKVNDRFPDLASSVNKSKTDSVPTRKKAPSPTSMPAAKILGPSDRDAQIKAMQARWEEYGRACQEPLLYWNQIIEKYPKSCHREEALCRAGRILCDSGKWNDGQSVLTRLVKEFPKNCWTGEACCRLIDMALERKFDLAVAKDYSEIALAWVKSAGDQAQAPASVCNWAMLPPGDGFPSPDLKSVKYRIYMRSGIISYLDQDYDNAVQLLTLGKGFFTVPDNVYDVGEAPPMGVERLLIVARKKRSLTPASVLKGEAKAKLILQLADLYYAAEDYDKGASLCSRVADDKNSLATKEQRSWALFKRARCIFGMDMKVRDLAAAQADYLAATNADPKAPWAFDGLFLSGNVLFNQGMPDKAIENWKRLVRDYPDCREAQRAAYYIGVGYETCGKIKEARQAYEKFAKEYPKSPFVTEIQEYHLKNLDKMEKQAGKSAKAATLPREN
jgi:tetratricopeptide (TPR) repeat protein